MLRTMIKVWCVLVYAWSYVGFYFLEFWGASIILVTHYWLKWSTIFLTQPKLMTKNSRQPKNLWFFRVSNDTIIAPKVVENQGHLNLNLGNVLQPLYPFTYDHAPIHITNIVICNKIKYAIKYFPPHFDEKQINIAAYELVHVSQHHIYLISLKCILYKMIWIKSHKNGAIDADILILLYYHYNKQIVFT